MRFDFDLDATHIPLWFL